MNLNNIKLTNVLLITVLIIAAIAVFRFFFNTRLREKKSQPDADGNFTISYFNRNNRLVKVVHFDRNGNVTRTVNSFFGGNNFLKL